MHYVIEKQPYTDGLETHLYES